MELVIKTLCIAVVSAIAMAPAFWLIVNRRSFQKAVCLMAIDGAIKLLEKDGGDCAEPKRLLDSVAKDLHANGIKHVC
jgi:hypothetical protein